MAWNLRNLNLDRWQSRERRKQRERLDEKLNELRAERVADRLRQSTQPTFEAERIYWSTNLLVDVDSKISDKIS